VRQKLSSLEKIAVKAEALIDKIDALLPAPPINNWQAIAYKWQKSDTGIFGVRHNLVPIMRPHVIHLRDLHDIDEQKSRLVSNTKQFLAGLPANNVLLTGARGTGKSSLVKALLTEFSKKGLRIIEVERADLIHLPEIAALVANRQEKFIIFADDLSFDAFDAGYKALKSVLDGGLAAPAANVLVYATSNRQSRWSKTLRLRIRQMAKYIPAKRPKKKYLYQSALVCGSRFIHLIKTRI
jgi:uncharacterized protein